MKKSGTIYSRANSKSGEKNAIKELDLNTIQHQMKNNFQKKHWKL
jgi:hypothetical protein